MAIDAVLDVGSNTIRLLVGQVEDGHLVPLLDRSEFVRLGRRVDESGRLQPDREQAGIEAIARLAEAARAAGAGRLMAIATSAVRDASNGQEFVDRVKRETGVTVEIISGDREAQLTFRGAANGGVLVCDLGGGSAELISADSTGIQWERSEKLGSGRLSERFVHHDPPRQNELEAAQRHVLSVLEALPPAQPRTIICTGGTASHVAFIAGSRDVKTRLTTDRIARLLDELCTEPASAIAERYSIPRERADVLPAGTAALLAIASFYGRNEILITRSGIREGALLAAS
jgi:exopolyphosphatase / guanosine-5'-triphosphate,3'-diphosphate pyrophosphatase